METSIEYLQTLESELKYLPKKEMRKVILIYQEKINNALDSGEKIEKILKDMPSPTIIAEGIYKSKQVNYLEKRKKEHRRQDLINGFTSLLLMLIVIIIFVGIIGYITYTLFDMGSIIGKFNKNDQLVMGTFTIAYILAMIVIIVFLIELGLLISSFLLSRFLEAFPKLKISDDRLQELSIISFIDKITHCKHLMGKVLIGLVTIMAVFGLTSLFSKAYLYRSFADIPTELNKETFLVDDDIKKIVINNTTANIMIKKGDALEIIKDSEFARNFRLSTTDDVLSISFDEQKKYDFLGILNEPTILITITIPSDYLPSLDITLKSGQVGVSEVILTQGSFQINQGGLAIKDSTIDDLLVTTNSMQFDSNSNQINKCNIDNVKGKFASSDDQYQEAIIKNASGDIAMQNNYFKKLNLDNTSGTIVIKNSQIDEYDYQAVAAILTMSDITSKTFSIISKNASQYTFNHLTSNIFTFELNTGYINASDLKGDINIPLSLSNIYLDKIVGNVTGNIENSKFSIYSSIFKDLKINLKKCELDLDDVKIDNINVIGIDSKGIMLDVYSQDINMELMGCTFEYYNNDSSTPISKVYLKMINTSFIIDKTVKITELVRE